MKKDKNELKNNINSLEDILDNVSSDVNVKNIKNIVDDINKKKRTFIDFSELQLLCDEESSEMINTAAIYFLPEPSHTNPYIIKKTENDKIILSKILFQLKTGEMAYIKLLEKIDEGDTAPRNFEVMSMLQKSQMEIVKHLVQIKAVIENSYRYMSDDIEKIQLSKPSTYAEIDKKIGMGHKNLLQQINK